MHVERRRIAAQHVIVDGGYVEAVLDQLAHHRIDLALGEHQVAHHHDAAMRRLECHPAAERERRLDGDAVERDGEIAARKAVAMNVGGDRGRAAERGVDLLPIDRLRARRQGEAREHERYRQGCECTHLATSMMGLQPVTRLSPSFAVTAGPARAKVRSLTAFRMRERPKQRANFHRERCGADHPAIHAQTPRHASAAQSLDGTRLTGSLPVPGDRNVGPPIRLRKTATRPCDRPHRFSRGLAAGDRQLREHPADGIPDTASGFPSMASPDMPAWPIAHRRSSGRSR